MPPSSAPAPPGPVGPSVGPTGPLDGVVVLDLATFGPAAKAHRLLADYGATVVKVGAVSGSGVETPRTPVLPLQRVTAPGATLCSRPQGSDRAGRLPGAGARRPTSWWRASGRAWSTGWASGSRRCRAVNPRVIPCSTTGYGQDGPRSAWAGHDLNYLAVGGYLHCAGRRADGGPALTWRHRGGPCRRRDARGLAIHGGADRPGAGRARACTSTSRSPKASCGSTSLQVDEHLATGAPVAFGHDVMSGRYACYDTYRARDGRWVAVGAIETSFFANLCRRSAASSGPAAATTTRPDAIRAEFAAAFARAIATTGSTVWRRPTPVSAPCWTTAGAGRGHPVRRPGRHSSRQRSPPEARGRGGAGSIPPGRTGAGRGAAWPGRAGRGR